MPQPHRTRKLRRIKVKLPGGRIKIFYRKRRPKIAHCANCKKQLHGIPRLIPSEFKKLPKSQRRPERIFSGQLCPTCLKKELINKFNTVNEKIEVGRLIVKTAGRDSGKIGVIIDIIDKNHVLIDGQVRRKKCNIQHIEILDQKIKIKQKATTDNVIKELKELKIDARKTKSKPKKERPIRQRKQKERTEEKPKKEKKVKKEKKNER